MKKYIKIVFKVEFNVKKIQHLTVYIKVLIARFVESQFVRTCPLKGLFNLPLKYTETRKTVSEVLSEFPVYP